MVLGWKVRFMMLYLVIHCGPEWPPFKRPAIVEKPGCQVNFQPDDQQGKFIKKKRIVFLSKAFIDGQRDFCG